MQLSDRKWKEFKISELFKLEKCKCSNVSLLRAGKMPYIGATNRNNGIMRFVENNDKLVTEGK